MLETKKIVKMAQSDRDDPNVGGCIACGWTIEDLPPDAAEVECPNCGEYHTYGHNTLPSTGCLEVFVPAVKQDTNPIKLVQSGSSATSTTTSDDWMTGGLTQEERDAAWKRYGERMDNLFTNTDSPEEEDVRELEREMDALVQLEQGNPLSDAQYNGTEFNNRVDY